MRIHSEDNKTCVYLLVLELNFNIVTDRELNKKICHIHENKNYHYL